MCTKTLLDVRDVLLQFEAEGRSYQQFASIVRGMVLGVPVENMIRLTKDDVDIERSRQSREACAK